MRSSTRLRLIALCVNLERLWKDGFDHDHDLAVDHDAFDYDHLDHDAFDYGHIDHDAFDYGHIGHDAFDYGHIYHSAFDHDHLDQ